MNIIVSKNRVDYKSFFKVETLEKATSVLGSIDYLIFNKSSETSDEKLNYMSMMKKKAKTILYICNEKDTDLAVKMMVVGAGGKYFDDEFFLGSDSELNNLVNSLEEVTEIAELGGVNVLSDFLNRYLKNGSSSFNQTYLSVVKEAVQDLLTDYSNKNLEVLQMSETASEIFSSTAEVLLNMKQNEERMKMTLSKMEKDKSMLVSAEMSGRRPTNSITFFPQVSYMKDKKIIRIKEVGNFRYLVSLMLGFRIYLETIKNLRPKLIVVCSVGELIELQYQNFSWVTQKKVKDRRNYYNNIVFTNFPTKEVIQSLLDDDSFDTFIVVDRMKTSKKHILNSRGSLMYAISGQSVVNTFKLPIKDCFSSTVKINGSLFTLPMFEEFPIERSKRERMYLKECSSIFDMMLNKER